MLIRRHRAVFVSCARSRPLPSGRGERGRGTDATVEHQQPVLARQPGGVRGEDRVENAGVAVRLFLRQLRFRGQRSGHQAGASTHRQHGHHHAGPVSKTGTGGWRPFRTTRRRRIVFNATALRGEGYLFFGNDVPRGHSTGESCTYSRGRTGRSDSMWILYPFTCRIVVNSVLLKV